MKLENVTDLYFVLSIFVPGFIYNGMLRQFVPLHESTIKETIFLKLLTATAFNYAFCAPIIYFFLFRQDIFPISVRLGAWFVVIFIAPIIFAIIRAKSIQSSKPSWIFGRLGLRIIDPIPTGWDWIFSRVARVYVLITLTDGTEIAGLLGEGSFVSSDPEKKDIFIEKVYTVPNDGTPWVEVPGSLGMLVDGGQIAYIEFKG